MEIKTNVNGWFSDCLSLRLLKLDPKLISQNLGNKSGTQRMLRNSKMYKAKYEAKLEFPAGKGANQKSFHWWSMDIAFNYTTITLQGVWRVCITW